MNQSYVQTIASREPWRVNQGQPKNALDPIWAGYERPTCTGSIEFESLPTGATGWWFCSSCGYCGRGAYTLHKVVQNPTEYFFHSLVYYWRQRVRQGTESKLAYQQALFTAGVALRYAASRPPTDLSAYIDKLSA